MSPIEQDKREHLTRIRCGLEDLSKQDRIGNLILIAQDPKTGLFLHEVHHDPRARTVDLLGMIGILETLKLELTERAAMAPSITLDGDIIDPYAEASA